MPNEFDKGCQEALVSDSTQGTGRMTLPGPGGAGAGTLLHEVFRSPRDAGALGQTEAFAGHLGDPSAARARPGAVADPDLVIALAARPWWSCARKYTLPDDAVYHGHGLACEFVAARAVRVRVRDTLEHPVPFATILGLAKNGVVLSRDVTGVDGDALCVSAQSLVVEYQAYLYGDKRGSIRVETVTDSVAIVVDTSGNLERR